MQRGKIEFIYDAADCRIFYTRETWMDYSQLWAYAVNAISDSKLCVAGSTGFSSTKASSQAPLPPPTPKSPAYNASALLGTNNGFTNTLNVQDVDFSEPPGKRVSQSVHQACNNHGNDCPIGRCQFSPKSDGAYTNIMAARSNFAQESAHQTRQLLGA